MCCDSWGRKELDTTEQLNWTELNVILWVFYLQEVNYLPLHKVCHQGEMLLQFQSTKKICIIYHDNHQNNEISTHSSVHFLGFIRNSIKVLSATVRRTPDSVQFSRSLVSDSLQPHEPQHARPPCPSPTPRVYPNSCPLSQWCHPTISSSVIPFSSCLQSFRTRRLFKETEALISKKEGINTGQGNAVNALHPLPVYQDSICCHLFLPSFSIIRLFYLPSSSTNKRTTSFPQILFIWPPFIFLSMGGRTVPIAAYS